jgi:hypothetical protein
MPCRSHAAREDFRKPYDSSHVRVVRVAPLAPWLGVETTRIRLGQSDSVRHRRLTGRRGSP